MTVLAWVLLHPNGQIIPGRVDAVPPKHGKIIYIFTVTSRIAKLTTQVHHTTPMNWLRNRLLASMARYETRRGYLLLAGR